MPLDALTSQPTWTDYCALGYSIAIAQTQRGLLTIVGAPRYKHQGLVLAVDTRGSSQRIHPNPEQVRAIKAGHTVSPLLSTGHILILRHCVIVIQTGAYFGAVVCAMKVDRDTITDLILISAPMYIDEDRHGRVYICTLSGLVNAALHC